MAAPATAPVVLFAETEPWSGFLQLAAALRRRGVRVELLTVPATSWRAGLRQRASRLVYDDVHECLAWAGGSAPVDVTGALPHLTDRVVTVQAVDHVAAALSAAGAADRVPALRQLRADLPAGLVYDKLAMTRHADGIGVAVPPVHPTLASVPDRYPVVVKARLGFGGQAVRMAQSRDELTRLWAELGTTPDDVFAQEVYDGPVVHVAGVALHGEPVQLAAYASRPADGDPLGPPAEVHVLDDPELLRRGRLLVEDLGYSGPFCLDFVTGPDGPAFIDFNSRAWGSWTALQRAGLDVIGALLYVVGVAPTRPSGRASLGAVVTGNPMKRRPGTPPGPRGVLASGRELLTASRLLGGRWLVVALLERANDQVLRLRRRR